MWVGQGSGLLGGGSFMVGDPLWIIFGVLAIVVGHRLHVGRAARAGLNHDFQVASAGPAVTASPKRTRGRRNRRGSARSRSTIPALVHRQVAEPGLAVGPAGRVEQRLGAELLDEPPQLARRDRLPAEIHEMDLGPTLLEEADRRPGRLVLLEAEDLDARRGGRTGRIRSHDAEGSGRPAPSPGTITRQEVPG